MSRTRKNANGDFLIECPGCGSEHLLDSRWTFNGDYNNPTFRASLLLTYGPFPEGTKGLKNLNSQRVFICHSWITDGQIQYLPDTTHSLSGRTVDLPFV